MVLTFSPIVNIFKLSLPQNAPSLIVFPETITLVKLLQIENIDNIEYQSFVVNTIESGCAFYLHIEEN